MNRRLFWLTRFALFGSFLLTSSQLWAPPIGRPVARPPAFHPAEAPGRTFRLEPSRPSVDPFGRSQPERNPFDPTAELPGRDPSNTQARRSEDYFQRLERITRSARLERNQASEAVKAEHAGRRDGRTLEISSGFLVRAASDSRFDQVILSQAKQILSQLAARSLSRETLTIVPLFRERSSLKAVEEILGDYNVQLPKDFGEATVKKLLDSQINRTVILLGHHHEGGMGFADARSQEDLRSVAWLESEASSRGIFLLPLGCSTGESAPLGTLDRLNSIDAVSRVGDALKAAANARDFLALFSGQHSEMVLDALSFSVPAAIEIREISSKEIVTTAYVPPAASSVNPGGTLPNTKWFPEEVELSPEKSIPWLGILVGSVLVVFGVRATKPNTSSLGCVPGLAGIAILCLSVGPEGLFVPVVISWVMSWFDPKTKDGEPTVG